MFHVTREKIIGVLRSRPRRGGGEGFVRNAGDEPRNVRR